jgi:uncharacterized membrane protein
VTTCSSCRRYPHARPLPGSRWSSTPTQWILAALAAGGGAGAALGAVAGHASGALSHDDLKALGEVLDQGDAGLVVVYPPEMADRVSTSVTAPSGKMHATAGITREQLAADVRAAEERSAASTGDA